MSNRERVELRPAAARILRAEAQTTLDVAGRFGPEAQTQRIRDLHEAVRELSDAIKRVEDAAKE